MQDLIFSLGALCFSAALLPSLLGHDKPPLSTSLLTGGWLWIFAATYISMGLTYSAVTTALTAALWTALAAQRIKETR